MIIEIKGVQFVNKGAELMLHAILKQLESVCPDAILVLNANEHSPYLDRIKLGAYQKLTLKIWKWDFSGFSHYFPSRLRRFLWKYGIVTEADVDVVLDASGFAYGQQWDELSTLHMCDEVKRYSRRGGKYIFLPQAFGPFEGKKVIRSLKNGISEASLIMAREGVSFEYLESVIGSVPALHVCPDFTNLLAGALPDGYQKKNDQVLFIPNFNMLSARNENTDWEKNYIEVMVIVMNVVRDHGLEPVILNHEGTSDMDVCGMLANKYGREIDVISESNPIYVKGIIGHSRLVVSSRFHGCVSALSQGVPCIGTSWSHKYEELFSGYECLDLLLKANITSGEADLMVSMALERKGLIDSFAEKEKNKVKVLWEKVSKIIQGDVIVPSTFN